MENNLLLQRQRLQEDLAVLQNEYQAAQAQVLNLVHERNMLEDDNMRIRANVVELRATIVTLMQNLDDERDALEAANAMIAELRNGVAQDIFIGPEERPPGFEEPRPLVFGPLVFGPVFQHVPVPQPAPAFFPGVAAPRRRR